MRARLPAALAAVALAATMAAPIAPATTQARSFVVYAKPTRAQFVNHNDDRERGNFTNPFGSDTLPTPPSANSGKEGARAGDNALFGLKLYSDLKLARPIGTATLSCTFTFAHVAICEGHFQLNGGTMIAMGPANLDKSGMVLPVTGGTGRYAGAHGQLTSRSSGKKNTQIIRFQLV
jgi:hypothetical protein